MTITLPLVTTLFWAALWHFPRHPAALGSAGSLHSDLTLLPSGLSVSGLLEEVAQKARPISFEEIANQALCVPLPSVTHKRGFHLPFENVTLLDLWHLGSSWTASAQIPMLQTAAHWNLPIAAGSGWEWS